MSTNHCEKFERVGASEIAPGTPTLQRRRRYRKRRRKPLTLRRSVGRGNVPPGDRGGALAQDDGSDAREFLQRAIAQVGHRVMNGRSMVALFAFVKGLSEIFADRWPPLRHELACELVKQILKQGQQGFGLMTAGECHPMTGWVVNFAQQETRSERYLG